MLTLSVVFGGLYRGCPASCGLLPSGSGVEGGSGLGWGWSMCWLSHVPLSLVRCEVACTAVYVFRWILGEPTTHGWVW